MKRKVKEWRVAGRLIMDSVSFALSSIRTDKLRTTLSLLGVTVGIFSIVAVFAVTASMQKNIEEGLNAFGSDVVNVSNFPMLPEDGEEYKWWEYMKRPAISRDDFLYVSGNMSLPGKIVFFMQNSGTVSHKRKSHSYPIVIMTTNGLESVVNYEIERGRSFTPMETKGGSNSVIIGSEIAEQLFGETDPIGKTIKIKGSNSKVIGIMKKQGESMASFFDVDRAVIIPLDYGRTIYQNLLSGGMIMAKPAANVPKDMYVSQLRMSLRSARGLTPEEKDDFSINEMTQIMSLMDEVFRTINLVGWIIGAFSLLIGGFGIANIMFVSVRERMNQIGIQKALGAKRYVILTQFLAESSFLSIMGGVTGVILVYIVAFIANSFIDYMQISLTIGQALAGMLIAIIIGIVSGLSPAYYAAKMRPVDAINS